MSTSNLTNMNDAQAVKALAALAQESRLRVFRLLVVAGPEGATPSEISERLGLPATALSFHLKELMHAQLVTQERQGRHLRYRAEIATMDRLLGFLTAHCCQGQPCLEHTSSHCAIPSPHPGETMTTPLYNVLFLCTGNSARSIMAEALLNHLGQGKFRAYSAGSHPTGSVHPQAMDVLMRNMVGTQDLHSKSWDEFAQPGAPVMHFVLTVCDKAAGETCPLWPGQPMSAHWGVPDPVATEGSEDELRKAHSDAFLTLHRRISLFLNLPIEKLDRLSLQNELSQIGRQSA